MAVYNRFDIADAHFWWNADHHEGQWSASYSRLCRIGRYFNASPLANGPATENAQEIYQDLCAKEGCEDHGST